MKIKNTIATAILLFGMGAAGVAQEGQVNIKQDEMIPKLLELKTEMGKESRIGDRYRIQIFSGDYNKAGEILREYRSLYPDWEATIVFETPNNKVWVGNFRNSLEADRALQQIKKDFPAAFRFKPERK